MKSLFYFVALLSFVPLVLKAQNMPPAINNLSVNHVVANQSVIFSFDLTDAENDDVDLQIQISADSGRTWLLPLDSVVGDVGYPIQPGIGKTITWVYKLTALSSSFPNGNRDFSARIVADDRMPIDIQAITNQVDSSRLVQTLGFLEGIRHRVTNPTHLNVVRDSIRDLMSANGLQDWHHTWSFSGFTGENFSGRLSGLSDEAKTWLISGHYDSVMNSPGADDNGSATAAVMEAVRVLSKYNFQNSIRFTIFDLEEAGLRGSKEYVTNHIPVWEQTAGLINMEMIGYKDTTANSQSLPSGFDLLFPAAYQLIVADSFRGNFLANIANTASNTLKIAFDDCAAAYVPDLKVISMAVPGNGTVAPDLRRSDHAPFWDAGYQALMLSDAANLRNPNYHSPSDTMGTLDFAFFFKNVKAVVATLAKLASPQHAGFALSSPVTIEVPVGLTSPTSGSMLTLFPNPASGTLQIDFEVEIGGPVSLFLIDNLGKKVAVISEKQWPAGPQSISWSRVNASQRKISAGNYWLILQQNGKRHSHTVRFLD